MFSKGVLAIFGLFLIFLVPDIHLSISDLMLYLSMNMSTDMLLLLKQDFSCTKINNLDALQIIRFTALLKETWASLNRFKVFPLK